MLGNIQEMMGKLQEAQKQSEEIKARLETVLLKEDSGEIVVTINGNKEIKDVEISDSLMEDREELQDKLVISLNKAIKKAEATYEQEMESVAKGMLPGMDMFK